MSRRFLAVAALCVAAAALAAVAVSGVEWLLVGTVAIDEVHAPARYLAGAAIGIALTMLTLLGVALYEAFRRRAPAAQLRGQEELARLAAIVDSVDDAVIGTDVDGTIVSWNAGAVRLFGYTSREASGKHISMLVPPEPEPERALHRRLVAEGRTVKSHDVVRLAKDGRRVDVSVTRSPIRDEAGTMIGVARIYRDIGEAKRAAATQQRLSTIVEHSNAAMLTRTLDGTITSWNAAAERLFGYTAAEAIGRHYTLVYPKSDAEHPARAEQLQAGHTIAPFRATRVAKDGSEIDVLVSVSPLTNAAGALEAIAVAFQDLSQLRQAEIALSESEERFEAAFEQAGVGMALRALDPVHPRWLRVNQKLCEILGYTEAELLTMTSLDVTPLEDRAVSLGHGQRLLDDRCERYSREKRYVRKDGTIIWVNLALSIVRRRDGTPQHLISIVEDISARKYAEERLHLQARMLDMVGEAVVGTDPAGTVTYWNRHAERLYGWKAAEAVGKNIADVTTSPASREAREQIVRQLAGRNTTSGELELQRRDGTPFIAMVTTAPVIDAAGDIVGYVGISRDITQRKHAEQALLETQRKLELAMASANVGFWYWDIPAGQISYSREWKAQLGYRDDEIGDSFSEWQRLCHPDDLDRVYGAAQAALRERRTTYDVEFRMRHKDGSYRWFLSRASIHLDESGEPLRAIGGHIDITERKKTETQLARKTAFYAALADTNEAIAMVDDEA
ncbi:MAG: PAS domain S-box protein, partial [Rhodospirillaceae bacterium]